ncbi:hypothetical protein [Ferrovibrio sp.]|uniref:hypothetical protein n=1 Tax=Ferrovibrio sp. TaxID=1917215 RepID=UPI0025C1125B|nr:hypothetical protein [Ferrovibrio sp.]MBX3455553.1 hypothetical protein [Ferrovibrio sp.]
MTLGNLVLSLIPVIGLFFLVGLSANWLEQMAEQYARRELKYDEEVERLRLAQEKLAERSAEVDRQRDLKAERERTLAQVQAESAAATASEIRLSDPRSNVVYEIGIPSPGAVGCYAKAVGPANTYPFDGSGSTGSGVHGRRYARFVLWGKDKATAERMVKQWAGTNGQILAIRPFTGKLKLTEY